jgi:hypothetical protein
MSELLFGIIGAALIIGIIIWVRRTNPDQKDTVPHPTHRPHTAIPDVSVDRILYNATQQKNESDEEFAIRKAEVENRKAVLNVERVRKYAVDHPENATVLVAISGLSIPQVTRMVGASSRRQVDNWVHGEPIPQRYAERVRSLTERILPLGDTPEIRKRKLLHSAHGISLFHQFLSEVTRDEVIQANHPISVRDRLALPDDEYDTEEEDARAPESVPAVDSVPERTDYDAAAKLLAPRSKFGPAFGLTQKDIEASRKNFEQK